MTRLLLVLLAATVAACADPPLQASVSVAEALSGDTTGYARADRVRPFTFPADHGPHPTFKTEWWYVTGNLRATDGSGRRFGVQFTVFRSALSPDTTQTRTSAWATTQLYMAHVALSAPGSESGAGSAGERFYSEERFARGAAGLAGATADPVHVWLGPVDLTAAGPPGAGGAIPLRIVGSAEGAAFALDARPTKPVVLQGDRGLSQKGAEAGNASYYYAQTRMATVGTVTLPPRPGRAGGEAVPVEGLTWLDREWSTSALGGGQTGWDWFALHLDAPAGEGRDLMLYQLRGADGRADPLSEGSLVDAQGRKTRLAATAFSLVPLERWTAPDGAAYPTRWRVRVPSEGIDVEVSALIDSSELNATVRYWEGAVDVTGSHPGSGFLEMTGYADVPRARSGAVTRTETGTPDG